MSPIRRALLGLAALALVAGARTAAAEDYPSRPVKIIVSFAPGGIADTTGRLIAQGLGTAFDKPVIVENRPGAGAIVGIALVAKAPPDGYTLLLANTNVSTNPALYAQLPYDADRELIPVANAVITPAVLVVHPALPVATIDDFLALARAKPGQIDYASVGVGSFPHYDMIMFEKKAGIDLIDVPLKGGASEVVTNMASGEVQAAFLNVATTAGLIKSGNLRPLAVVSSKRLADYPDVPTMAEAGYPGIGTEQWNTLFARAGTPPEVLDVLFKASVEALHSEQAQKIFAPQYIRVIPSDSPAEAARWIRQDIEHWRDIVKVAGLKVD